MTRRQHPEQALTPKGQSLGQNQRLKRRLRLGAVVDWVSPELRPYEPYLAAGSELRIRLALAVLGLTVPVLSGLFRSFQPRAERAGRMRVRQGYD